MTQWLIGIFVRYLAPKMTYEDGKQCFLYLQPPTVSQTVGAVRGWENELFLISRSSFPLPLVRILFSKRAKKWYNVSDIVQKREMLCQIMPLF